jgi:hypothetical protein
VVLTQLQLQGQERRQAGAPEPMTARAMRDPPPPAGRAGRPIRRLLSPPAILVLAMAALVVLVPPAGEFAMDDWGYARVIEILVDQGRLEIHPWVAASVVLQAGWGGLFAHLFGFSHTALRASTLVLAAATVLGFYVLLRDLLDPGRALLGALLLLINPLYVFLAYSFMTEVPFQCLAIWALVERGIPPEEINGGFERNGWYRGQAAIAAAVQQAPAGGSARRLQGQIVRSLRMRDACWVLAFAPPRDAAGRVLAAVPYWGGQRVLAIERD